jgi:hypothetical protein
MENLIEKTKKELLDIAKSLGLKGISKLSKSEIIDLIENNKKLISSDSKLSSDENNKEEVKLLEKKEDKKLLPKVEDKKLLTEVYVASEGYYQESSSYNEM